MLIIGRLKHRLTLQRYGEAQDPNTGAIIEGWETLGSFNASVEGVSGREFLAANAEQSATTWRITLRYRSDILGSDRLVMGETVFNISAILPDNNRTRLVLMCQSGVNAG
jgi:SPP1 family predicted phage head-tail adaptor